MHEYLPQHVYFARLMLINILDGDGYTQYDNNKNVILFSPKYICITNSVGFVTALLEKSYNIKLFYPNRKKLLSSKYYHLDSEEYFFTQTTNIMGVSVGDFIIVESGFGSTCDLGDKVESLNNNFMLINERPQLVDNDSIPKNTLRWSINVIVQHPALCNSINKSNKINGLQKLFINIYTDYPGNLLGYILDSKYIDKNIQPIIIGRINLRN